MVKTCGWWGRERGFERWVLLQKNRNLKKWKYGDSTFGKKTPQEENYGGMSRL